MARTSAVPATPARKARAVMANATCAALIAAAVAVVASSPPGAGPSAGGGSNLGRFAALTFGGDRGGRAALVVASTDSCGRGAAGPSPGPSNVPPVAVTQYCTPNGWLLRPAGTQIDTPRAPTGVTVSPDHQTAYVVNSGIFDQQLVVIDAKTLTKTTALATDLYMGVAADRSGNVWASGGSRNRVFQFFDAGPVAVGTRHVGLVPGSPNNGIPVAGYPGNMALGHDASAGKLFVAGNLSVPQAVFGGTCPNGAPAADPICSVISVIDVSNPSAQSPAVSTIPVGRDAYGVVLSADGKKLYVSNWADETNPGRAGGAGTVSVVDVATQHEVQVAAVGHHPTGLALSADGTRLAVTNSADDSVSVLSLGPDGSVASTTTTSVRTVASAPYGAAPLAVSFDPSGSYLYVALAGENAVEVLTGSGQPIPQPQLSVPHTYIPTAWYPSALAASPDPAGSAATSRLYVTNLKGIGAGPGPNGQAEPFSGSRTQGTVSAIDVPSDPASSQLTTWTNTVVENNNWGSLFANTGVGPCQGAPADSPLCLASVDANYRSQLHAIFIVKENKTFDQYFGDIAPLVPNADADPTWLLYGMPVTTNQHLLAQRYTISDHFWADSEQSTTGHKWTSAGYATEHDEITWNTEYDQGLRGDRSDGQYDGQLTGPKDQNIADQEGAIDRPTSRLVDSTEGAGLSTRVYSDDVNPGSKVLANGDRVPQEAWGIGPSNSNHGRDLDFPDSDRANIFLHGSTTSHEWSLDKTGAPPSTYGTTIALCGAPQADPKTCSGGASVPDGSTPYQHFSLDAWTAAYNACNPNHDPALDAGCQKAMPQYLYVALPVDHTLGFNPQSPTPASMVADNDYSVGKIIDALSHSPFWSNTVVFITEDDTQASGDHVDSHRTFLLTAGGLAHHATAGSPTGSASHQQGSFPSVLKTVEVLLGVPQLTIYDTAAQPLDSVLVAHASDAAGTPSYTAVASPTAFFVLDGSLPPTNPPGTTLAQLSALMDWRLDRTSPQLVRDVLYAGIRGWPLPSRDLALLNR